MSASATSIAFELVDLTGAPPVGVDLPPLPSMAAGIEVLSQAFSALTPESPELSPCVVIYAAGHAWIGQDKSPAASLRLADGESRVLSGIELFSVIEERAAGRNAIVVLDVCHARAFEETIKQLAWRPWAVVFASGKDQPASAFLIDKATRLMTALSRYLITSKTAVDLDEVFARVAMDLGRVDVIAPQSVEVFRFGPRLRLLRQSRMAKSTRGVTVSTIRGALFGVGAALAVALIASGWFYITHAWIEINLGDLASLAGDVQISVTQEDPRVNLSTEVFQNSVQGHVLRARVPASDIVVRVLASYPDRQARTLNFPLLLSPGIGWQDKFRNIALPPTDEILKHPHMAYVAVESWVKTPGQPPLISSKRFWIDIYPLTVAKYEPILLRFLDGGMLSSDQSVMAKRVTPDGLHRVGADKLGQLADALAPILNIVNAAARERPVAQLPVVSRLAAKPCGDCPAPVSYEEAALYCSDRGARVPEYEELELAGRGVDGRRYPWGDRYDDGRANALGLPEKGAPPTGMKPVDSFPAGQSPFGVMDIVGNAGKWVAQDDDSYPTYIGASFRQSGEEIEPFSRIPYVEGTSIPEISVRCVED